MAKDRGELLEDYRRHTEAIRAVYLGTLAVSSNRAHA